MTTNILVLESNPQGTSQLRLNQEIREIEDALERGKYAEEFILQSRLAVRVEDLQRSLRQEKARIVHFCGHGTGSQGLVLETTSGQQQLLDTQAIADLFKLFKNQVECVVLNACYSKVQAVEINQHINYVIGTKQSIRDDAAIEFSKGFYEALADGETIDRAYEFGCNRIQLEIYGNSDTKRKLVPVYSEAESKWVELPQDEVIELLIKEPLNTIEESSVSLTADKKAILQLPFNPRSPYKGLKRFNAKDKDLFFGRERLIKKLIKAVDQSNLVLVLGASGSGKSSVVRAGVIPQIEDLSEVAYQSCLFTPNRDPFVSCHRSLLDPEEDIFNESEVEFVLEGKSDTLTKTADLLKSKHPQWLIFVDQFEELFTICSNLETRRNFIQGIIDIAKDNDKSVKLILAMRSDFLEELGAYPEFSAIAEKNINLVADMQAEEWRQAIEQPAAQHGVLFEAGLVKEIIQDVQGQAGSLPLLQYTLDLLWQEDDLSDRTLNISTYRQLGGVSGALQKHVNQIYNNLSQAQQLATKQILLRLVDVVALEKSEVLRTAVSKRAYKSEFTEAQVQTVNLLIDKSLLVSDDLDLYREGQSTVEIAHEALLTSWGELKDWISEALDTISLNNRLADDAQRWEELKKENPKQANEELWSGSKLEKVIELRKDGTFDVVLGGLSDRANDFINASIDWRDKEQKEKTRLQRRAIKWLSGGLATALVATVAAIWQWRSAVHQSKMVFVRQLATTSFVTLQSSLLGQNELELKSGDPVQRRTLLAVETFLFVTLQSSLLGLNELVGLESGDPVQRSALLAVESLRRFPTLTGGIALRRSLEMLPLIKVSEFNVGKEVKHCVLSPVDTVACTKDGDSNVRLWDSNTGQMLHELNHSEAIKEIVFSPNGRLLAASGGLSANVWSIDTGQLLADAKVDSAVKTIALSANEKWLAIGTSAGEVYIWDLDSQKRLAAFSGSHAVFSLTFGEQREEWGTKHGDLLAAAYADNRILIWELDEQKSTSISDINATILQHGQPLSSIDFSPDGKRLLAAGVQTGYLAYEPEEGTVMGSIPNGRNPILWDWKSKTQVPLEEFTYGPYGNTVGRIPPRFDHSGRWVIGGGLYANILLWDAESGRLEAEIPEDIVFEEHPQSAFVTTDEQYVISVTSTPKEIDVWNLESKTKFFQIHFENDIDAVDVNRHNLMFALSDGIVRVWQRKPMFVVEDLDWQFIGQVPLEEDANESKEGTVENPSWLTDDQKLLASDNQGGFFVTSEASGETFVRDRAGKTVASFNPNQFLAFSPQGPTVILAVEDKLSFWDVRKSKMISTGEDIFLDWDDEPIPIVHLSNTGRWLLNGLTVWDVSKRDVAARLETVYSDDLFPRFSSDDQWLFIKSSTDYDDWPNRYAFRLWHIPTWKQPDWLATDKLYSIVFSDDAEYLASAVDDGPVSVWELATGQEVARPLMQSSNAAIEFQNGTRFLKIDGDLHFLWPQDLNDAAQRRLSRNLTTDEWKVLFPGRPYKKTFPDLPSNLSSK